MAEMNYLSNKKSAISMDVFPRQAGFENANKNVDTKNSERGQLIISYGGNVVLYNNFPANKANGLIKLAAKRSSKLDFASQSKPLAVAIRPPISCLSTPFLVQSRPSDLADLWLDPNGKQLVQWHIK